MPTHLPPVAAFDLETCARPGEDARNPEHAISVQASMVLMHPAGQAIPERRRSPLLNIAGTRSAAEDETLAGLGVDVHHLQGWPSLANPGVPINPEAEQVHGITDEQVADAPPEGEMMARLRDELAYAVVNEYVLVAANAHYDLTVLDRRNRANVHTDRVGESLGRTLTERVRYLRVAPLLVFDPMVIDRWADKFRKGKRTLSDLCQFYRVPLEGAHDADADATAAALVLARMFAVAEVIHDPDTAQEQPDAETAFEIAERITTPDRFRTVAVMDAETLHNAQVRWRHQWAENFQDYLRHKAPADRRDPEAVVDGSWPILPLPAPAPEVA